MQPSAPGGCELAAVKSGSSEEINLIHIQKIQTTEYHVYCKISIFAIMRFLAAIFSCLILILSAGANGTILLPKESGKAEVAGGGCCGCCCECGSRQAQDDGADDTENPSQHKCCPFCISNTCPGFAVVFTVDMPAMLAELYTEECAFIQHKYISPSADGIWQPPRTA